LARSHVLSESHIRFRPIHGHHTLPDGTLTPLHVIMALIVARDGTVYATTIYPFTLLKIASRKAVR